MAKAALQFITFTGVDKYTSVDDLAALAADYPVEFGFLFSLSRSGEANHPRYPDVGTIEDIVQRIPATTRIAAHICGDMASEIIDRGGGFDFGSLLREFHRIQINVRTPPSRQQLLRAALFGEENSAKIIFQAREGFPPGGSLERLLAHWLFDTSGGEGRRPDHWPRFAGSPEVLCGYAGGINPENVRETIDAIEGATSLASSPCPRLYWIDMESGVRTDDQFDIAKCRAVCEAVYGAPRSS